MNHNAQVEDGVEMVLVIQPRIVHVQIVTMTQNVVLVDGVEMVRVISQRHVVV